MLLAKALTKRAQHVSPADKVGLLREAMALFQGHNDVAAVAETRATLAAALDKAGDPDAAIVELEKLLAEYRSLAPRNELYGRRLGVALLDLGRLYGVVGRRPEAKQTTKAAVAEFRRGDLANLSRAKEQLSRLRWRR